MENTSSPERKTYTVMYEGINLFEYAMTPEERNEAETLRSECISILNELGIPARLGDSHEYQFKYHTRFGYYAMAGDRGLFSLLDGFPEANRERAKYLLLSGEFSRAGFSMELHNRDALKVQWSRRFPVPYESRKPAFDYIVQMVQQTCPAYAEEAVGHYLAYLGDGWSFYWDSMQFAPKADG